MIPPMTKSEERLAKRYCDLMEEIKWRDKSIIGFLNMPRAQKDSFVIPPPLMVDFCYLQLRIICELIALGCMLMHKDIPETRTKNMRTEWNATKMAALMKRLHPNFFPDPLFADDVKKARGSDFKYLTKERFNRLYGDISKKIHRGSLEDVMAQRQFSINVSEIGKWRMEIYNLLMVHWISIKGGDVVYRIQMSNPADKTLHCDRFERIYDGQGNPKRPDD